MIRFVRKSLAREEGGAAIIELAIVAPVIALLTIGVVDMSNGFSRKLQLEQAAHRSIEKVMQTTGVDTVEETIKAEAAAQAGVNADQVTVTYTLECNSVVQSDATASCAAGEIEARYIQVRVMDRYQPLFPVRFAGVRDDGTYHVSATAGMRTQ